MNNAGGISGGLLSYLQQREQGQLQNLGLMQGMHAERQAGAQRAQQTDIYNRGVAADDAQLTADAARAEAQKFLMKFRQADEATQGTMLDSVQPGSTLEAGLAAMTANNPEMLGLAGDVPVKTNPRISSDVLYGTGGPPEMLANAVPGLWAKRRGERILDLIVTESYTEEQATALVDKMMGEDPFATPYPLRTGGAGGFGAGFQGQGAGAAAPTGKAKAGKVKAVYTTSEQRKFIENAGVQKAYGLTKDELSQYSPHELDQIIVNALLTQKIRLKDLVGKAPAATKPRVDTPKTPMGLQR